MRLPSAETLSRTGFILSLAALAFFYGLAADRFGWFPSSLLDRAARQGRAVIQRFDPPSYLHPRRYDRTGVRTPAPGKMQPGLTLVTSAWVTSDGLTPGLRLIDRRGETVHRWQVDPGRVFDEASTEKRGVENLDIQGSHLLEDGDVAVNLEYGGTLRLDACSSVRWLLPEGNHHSIDRAGDGSFWIPAVSPEPRHESPGHPDGFPGLEHPVYQDRILRVAGDGTVLRTIHVLDVLYENGLAWHLAEEAQIDEEDDDPTHLNDVEPLPAALADEYPAFEAGDLLVSLRHVELVFVMDPETERVRWHASGPFILQHDPDFLGDGWIGVFDNRSDGTERGTMLGGSRIVALRPGTESVRVLFPTPRSEPFYTNHRGKWELLENGNLLLVEEMAGRVVEVAPDGRTVWEWIVEPYRESEVPSVTKAVRVDLTREEVASWPCSSDAVPDNTRETRP